MLTDRQQAIYDFILDFRRHEGCSPSIPEIQKHFEIRSPNGVMGHLLALQSKGYIRRSDRGSRQIDVTGPNSHDRANITDLPVVGSVVAGYPESAVAHPDSLISIDEQTLGFRPRSGFALKVRGDSMKDACILDGDTVVVDPAKPARERDIVVALLDGSSTLKRLVKVRGQWFLKAENYDYPEMHPKDSLSVQGVVRAVIRRLG